MRLAAARLLVCLLMVNCGELGTASSASAVSPPKSLPPKSLPPKFSVSPAPRPRSRPPSPKPRSSGGKPAPKAPFPKPLNKPQPPKPPSRQPPPPSPKPVSRPQSLKPRTSPRPIAAAPPVESPFRLPPPKVKPLPPKPRPLSVKPRPSGGVPHVSPALRPKSSAPRPKTLTAPPTMRPSAAPSPKSRGPLPPAPARVPHLAPRPTPPTPLAPLALPTTGNTTILSAAGANLCLVPHPVGGRRVVVATCDGSARQLWTWSTAAKTLVSAASGLCLTYNSNLTAGSAVTLQACVKASRLQQWRYRPFSYAPLMPLFAQAWCLHIDTFGIADNAPLSMWDCSTAETDAYVGKFFYFALYPAKCSDVSPMCPIWRKQGRCASNRPFMSGSAPTTLGVCPVSCSTCPVAPPPSSPPRPGSSGNRPPRGGGAQGGVVTCWDTCPANYMAVDTDSTDGGNVGYSRKCSRPAAEKPAYCPEDTRQNCRCFFSDDSDTGWVTHSARDDTCHRPAHSFPLCGFICWFACPTEYYVVKSSGGYYPHACFRPEAERAAICPVDWNGNCECPHFGDSDIGWSIRDLRDPSRCVRAADTVPLCEAPPPFAPAPPPLPLMQPSPRTFKPLWRSYTDPSGVVRRGWQSDGLTATDGNVFTSAMIISQLQVVARDDTDEQVAAVSWADAQILADKGVVGSVQWLRIRWDRDGSGATVVTPDGSRTARAAVFKTNSDVFVYIPGAATGSVSITFPNDAAAVLAMFQSGRVGAGSGDWATNFETASYPELEPIGVNVAQGFHDMFTSVLAAPLQDLITATLQQLQPGWGPHQSTGARIFWIGHSQGAGLAAISSAYFYAKGFPFGGAYLFADPAVTAVGDAALRNYFKINNLWNRVFRIVNSNDIIPGAMNIGKYPVGRTIIFCQDEMQTYDDDDWDQGSPECFSDIGGVTLPASPDDSVSMWNFALAAYSLVYKFASLIQLHDPSSYATSVLRSFSTLVSGGPNDSDVAVLVSTDTWPRGWLNDFCLSNAFCTTQCGVLAGSASCGAEYVCGDSFRCALPAPPPPCYTWLGTPC